MRCHHLMIVASLAMLASAGFAADTAHYAFDGDTLDSSPFANNGVFSGGTPNFVAGQFGQSLDFDGANDVVTVSSNPQANFGTSDFSISTWVNRDGDGAGAGLEGIYDKSPGAQGTSLLISPAALGAGNNRVRFAMWDPGSSASVIVDSTGTLTGNAGWQHLVITVDRDDPNGLLFYIDGILDSMHDPTALNGVDLSTAKALEIGNFNGAGNTLNGQLDEFRFFDTALSTSEVTNLFNTNSTAVVPEPGSLLLWTIAAMIGLGVAWRRRMPSQR